VSRSPERSEGEGTDEAISAGIDSLRLSESRILANSATFWSSYKICKTTKFVDIALYAYVTWLFSTFFIEPQ
jgi:hypothetical protein